MVVGSLMAGRGELERAVMQVLWDNPRGVTARAVVDELPGRELAVTTIMTVLSRLCRKGLAVRDELIRPHEYRAAESRADHIADLMLDALGQTDDREAVLTRFLGAVSERDTDHLRRALGRHERPA
ncbi:MAG: BlaI/MecI/CopY family transcriptional regulator [Nakamurella sp.]